MIGRPGPDLTSEHVLEDTLNGEIVGISGAFVLDGFTMVGDITAGDGIATGPNTGPTSSGGDFNLCEDHVRKMPEVQEF